MSLTERHARLGLALVCLLTFFIYSLGFSGPFLFDDAHNIVLNPAIQIESLSRNALVAAWKGNDSGPLGRPVASISFALNFLVDGLDPYGYKLFNAALHVLCGVAIFMFVRALLHGASAAGRSEFSAPRSVETIAFLTSCLWLLAPLHVSAVLYVVQRMTLLSALFSFLALTSYCHGRLQQLQGKPGWLYILIGMPVAMIPAVLSKETGLLVPLLCACGEVFLLKWKARSPSVEQQLRWLYGLLLLIGLVILALIGPTVWRDLLGGYSARPFSMSERLLTEARVLFQYFAWIVAPDIGQMNLHHDDVVVSKGWLKPSSSMLAVAGLALAALTAIVTHRRWPLFGFSLFFFLIGHLLESSVLALELVFEHRNYLPAVGWLLLLATAITHLSETRPRIGLGLMVAVLIGSSALLGMRCWDFADEFRLLKHSLQSHPNSPRTQLWAGDYFRLMQPQLPPSQRAALQQQAMAHYRKAVALDPTDTIGLGEVLLADARAGKPPQADVVAELAHRYATQVPSAGTINGAFEFSREITDIGGQFPPELAVHLLQNLASNPKLGDAGRGTVLASVAALHLHRNDLEQALVFYRQAQSLRPKDPYLWISHAAAALQAGKLDEAEVAAQQAREYDAGELSDGLNLLEADIAHARSAATPGQIPPSPP